MATNAVKMITLGALAATAPASATGSGSGLDFLQNVQRRGAGSPTLPRGEQKQQQKTVKSRRKQAVQFPIITNRHPTCWVHYGHTRFLLSTKVDTTVLLTGVALVWGLLSMPSFVFWASSSHFFDLFSGLFLG